MSNAKPFLKWAGGKRQLLPELDRHLPKRFSRYYEPFIGGGALFFHLRNSGRIGPEGAVLSDANQRLVKAYHGVRDDVEWVIEALQRDAREHAKDPKEYFTKTRSSKMVDHWDPPEVASWLIYLNHTCFNGLYRVNQRGKFNVPIGDYDNPTICDEENLRACSAALQGVGLECMDFRDSIARAHAGDLVYCDPPYVPLSATSSFTSYTRDKFTDADQRDLVESANRALARGAHVVLSNSSASAVRELYAHWRIHEVSARRNVSCKGDRRGAVKELIITGSAT